VNFQLRDLCKSALKKEVMTSVVASFKDNNNEYFFQGRLMVVFSFLEKTRKKAHQEKSPTFREKLTIDPTFD